MRPRQLVRALVLALGLVFLLTSTGITHAQTALPQSREPSQPASVIPCPPPPIPLPPGCKKGEAETPPDLYLRLISDPDGAVVPGQIVPYWLVAQNSGHRNARNVRIVLSFAPDQQELLDVAFTKTGAWVSDIRAGEIEMQLGILEAGEIVTTTARLRTHVNTSLGTSLTVRARMFWEGRQKEPTLSNVSKLTVARVPAYNPIVQLEDSPPSDAPEAKVGLIYDGFASHEAIGLWYNQSDGQVIPLGQSRADAGGKLSYQLDTATFDSGRYELVAQGHYSRVIVVMAFTVVKAKTPLSKDSKT